MGRNVLQVRSHRTHVERAGDPEGPWERSALVGEVDAGKVGVHGGTSTRQATVGIDGEDTIHHHDTQQGRLGAPASAAHASAHRARVLSRDGVYSFRC